MSKTKTPTQQPQRIEISDTRHAAFAAYEQAVKDGFTFDPENPPEILMNGFTIVRMVKVEAQPAAPAPTTLVCTGKTSVKDAVAAGGVQ